MHPSNLCFLLCASLVHCKTLNSVQKNGGTVHFDNDEIYSNFPPPKASRKPSPSIPSGELEKPAYPPSMMHAPLHPNKLDELKPMNSSHPYPNEFAQMHPPVAPASSMSSPDEKSSTQNRVNGKAPNKISSIDEILNKQEPVDVTQAVLEKKNVMNDTRIQLILQRGITQMTLDMDRAIRAKIAKYENVLFSPLSVVGALALILLGSNGSTKSELINFIGIATGRNLENKTDVIHKTLGGFFDTLMPKPGAPSATEVRIANGVFYEDRFRMKKQYEQLAHEFYKTEIFPMDFDKQESAQFVNKWVSNRTAGKIDNLLPGPLSPQIALILANVIYFNGKWEHPFHPKYNSWEPFDLYSGNGHKEVVKIEMMTNMARVEYSNSPEAQILGLPYKGGQTYMYFILPKNPDLEEYTKDLDYNKFTNIINDTMDVEVIYSIPKLKISSSIELRPVLNSMNVTSMFDKNRSDLSNMLMEDGNAPGGVAVDQVFHKVEIDINEVGTEAAASTGIVITRISKPIVKVNRPFIFFILHRPTNSIVFWGSMYKPESHN